MPVALGPETEGRLRAYFSALLRPDEVDRAINSVQLRTVPSASAVEAFVAAHTVLGLYMRVSVDVEADVLVRDVGLTTEQAARVVGLTEAEVNKAVASAEAFEAEVRGEVTAETITEAPIETVGDESQAGAVESDAASADVSVGDDVAVDDTAAVAEEDQPPDDADAATEAAAHALRAERHLTPDADDVAEDVDADVDADVEPLRPWAAVDGNGHGATRSVVVIEADEDADVLDGPILAPRGRGRFYALLALVLVLTFAVGLLGYWEIQGSTTPPVTVTRAVMTTGLDNAGEPQGTRELFTVGERAILWLEYEPPAAPTSIGVQYFRSDEPLLAQPAEFALPADGPLPYPVSARLIDTPGHYRIEVTSRGEEVAEVEFDVEAA